MGHQAAQQLTPQARPQHWQDGLPSNGFENRKSPNCSAFTLIELMVVMVLIGIMTAMILPEMKGTYEDALLRSTSRELVSMCGLASSHAVSVNQAHRLRLDRKTGHYSIERRGSDRGSAGRFVAAGDVPGGEGELDNRISVEIHQSGDDPAEAADQQSSQGLSQIGRASCRARGVRSEEHTSELPSLRALVCR